MSSKPSKKRRSSTCVRAGHGQAAARPVTGTRTGNSRGALPGGKRPPPRGSTNEDGANCRDVVMTETTQRSVLPMTDDRELTNTEVEAFQRDALFEDPGSLSAEQYPRAWKSDRSNG